MTRQSRDQRFMDLAKNAIAWGTCPRAKVGAVLALGGRPLGPPGYNGAASGQFHCDEVGCLMVDGHCVRALHAEYNALKFVKFADCRGATMYVTHMPCYRCATMIVDAGVARVVYENDYRNNEKARRLLISACQLDQFIDGVAQQAIDSCKV